MGGKLGFGDISPNPTVCCAILLGVDRTFLYNQVIGGKIRVGKISQNATVCCVILYAIRNLGFREIAKALRTMYALLSF